MLICANSPAESAAPSVPLTASVVSLVTKSLVIKPVSVVIALMAMVFTAGSGAMVSITTFWLSVAPTLPAASITRT